MKFRRIRNIARCHQCRNLWIFFCCFTCGILFGAKINKSIHERSRIEEEDERSDMTVVPTKEGHAAEKLGRKLSVKSAKPVEPFSRLPSNFENIVLPPRSAAKVFTLEPWSILKRNRGAESHRIHYSMLFLVKSAPIHASRREIIRRSWGSVKYVDGMTFNTIFLLGNLGGNAPLQSIVTEENRIYGDILQSDAPEGYRNLPLKVLSAMQWMIVKSSEISSDFYTFTDDDCVMNLANIVNFFQPFQFVERDELSVSTPKMEPDNLEGGYHIHEIPKIDQTIHNKKKSVTLPIIHSVKAKTEELEVRTPPFYREPDIQLDRIQNDDVVLADPNARIQISRTGGEDDADVLHLEKVRYDISSEEKINSITKSPEKFQSFSKIYKSNQKHLRDYLKEALNISKHDELFYRRRLLSDAIYCGYCYDAKSRPHRNLSTKWGISTEIYSGDVYPTFCHGGMYTMSGNIMTSLFSISTVTDYSTFHLEDVLVTGILREKSGLLDSVNIRPGSNPKTQPLMYYVWDSGPRVMYKMSRKWRMYTKQLLPRSFKMEAIVNGKLVKWNNGGHN